MAVYVDSTVSFRHASPVSSKIRQEKWPIARLPGKAFAGATGTPQVAGIILAGLLCIRDSNYVRNLFGMFSKIGEATEEPN